MTFEIKTERAEKGALFFREAWVDGETDEGVPFEFTRTVGAGALVLQVGEGEDRITETVKITTLVTAWVKSIEASRGGTS